jgi:hypothetical protein
MNTAEAMRRPWWAADSFSPRDFVRHAGLIFVVFVVAHLCGLREYTSVLNGTTGSIDMNPQTAALLGVLYVLIYLGTILGVPMLLIAAGLMTIWGKRKAQK